MTPHSLTSLPRRAPGRPRAAGAFSLIEMMAVISVMAILLAITFPLYNSIERSNREGAGVNTLNVALTAIRAYSSRTRAGIDLGGGTTGNYSGTALIFTPSGEMRLTENTQFCKDAGGGWLEPTRNGYTDIPDRPAIALPKGAGFVGIKRNGSGADDLILIAPPFAIRFDERGKLIAGANVSSPDDRVVFYDGNYNGQYAVSSTRVANYDPADWIEAPPLGNGTADALTAWWNVSAQKYRLPFEVLEAVPAVIVFNQFDFEDAGFNLKATGTNGNLSSGAKDYILKRGRIVYFSRYTGNVIREGKVQ